MVQDFIELIKPYCLSIEETGSKVNPYIRNKHDTDLIAIVADEEEKSNIIALTHYNLQNKRQLRENKIDIKIKIKEDNLSNTIFAYMSHFIQPIEGYEKLTIEVPINELLIKQNIINYIQYLKEKELNFYKQKSFYHIYTSICIMKHNSYDLTEEEINNINILHDREEEKNEIRKQLIDSILEESSLWQLNEEI